MYWLLLSILSILSPLVLLVGLAGFEPATSAPRTQRALQLRYSPLRWRESYGCPVGRAATLIVAVLSTPLPSKDSHPD